MTEASASSYDPALSAKRLARKFLPNGGQKGAQVVMGREIPSPLSSVDLSLSSLLCAQ